MADEKDEKKSKQVGSGGESSSAPGTYEAGWTLAATPAIKPKKASKTKDAAEEQVGPSDKIQLSGLGLGAQKSSSPEAGWTLAGVEGVSKAPKPDVGSIEREVGSVGEEASKGADAPGTYEAGWTMAAAPAVEKPGTKAGAAKKVVDSGGLSLGRLDGLELGGKKKATSPEAGWTLAGIEGIAKGPKPDVGTASKSEEASPEAAAGTADKGPDAPGTYESGWTVAEMEAVSPSSEAGKAAAEAARQATDAAEAEDTDARESDEPVEPATEKEGTSDEGRATEETASKSDASAETPADYSADSSATGSESSSAATTEPEETDAGLEQSSKPAPKSPAVEATPMTATDPSELMPSTHLPVLMVIGAIILVLVLVFAFLV